MGAWAGTATAELRAHPDGYEAAVEARSAPWLAALYPIRDRYVSTFRADGATVRYEAEAREGDFVERRQVAFDGGVAVVRWTTDRSGAPASGAASKPVPEGVRDPISAIYAMRAAPLQEGESRPVVVFTGARVARLTARACAGEPAEPPTECVSFRSVGGEGTSLSVWFSTDGDRVPLRAAVETRAGRVRLELVAREDPSP